MVLRVCKIRVCAHLLGFNEICSRFISWVPGMPHGNRPVCFVKQRHHETKKRNLSGTQRLMRSPATRVHAPKEMAGGGGRSLTPTQQKIRKGLLGLGYETLTALTPHHTR